MTSIFKPSTVLIVGGGIAGPTLALLLQEKGYLPILVEKVPDLGDVGIALSLAPNGMKVLDRAGIALDLVNGPPSSPGTLRWDEFTSSGEFLGGTGLYSDFAETYGWPSIGITRTRLQTLLLDRCRDHGIPVHVGWKLAAFYETDDGIVARAEDGREVRADFIVGADGLKSKTRELLLLKREVQIDQPLFTNIVVRGGYSPMPASLQEVPAIRIWYGATEAVISHPLENGMIVWGLTCDAQNATSESWRTVPKNELDREITSTLNQLEGWAEPVRELVAGSRKIMTIGLYDRPELPIEHWYCGRGVLIGDAAHPTTPHIGQGANQALEDCWHLANLLPPCDASSTKTLSSASLEDVFHRMASIRQGPSSRIVKLGREQGEVRVVTDVSSNEAWKKRDDAIRAKWADVDTIKSFFDGMYKEPFDGKGGYAQAFASRGLSKE